MKASRLFVTSVLIACLLSCAASVSSGEQAALNQLGDQALETTKEMIQFGPRPPGSKNLEQTRDWLKKRLASVGINSIKSEPFKAATPQGEITMSNVIGIAPGKQNKILMLACHLDTKQLPKELNFVGANDATSACALIIELIPHLLANQQNHAYWFVFLDGEEAIEQWSPTDSLYGSRQLAQELTASSLKDSVTAFVLLDLIGNADLNMIRELNSSKELRQLVEAIAKQKGYEEHFFATSLAITDDHLPFKQIGIPVLDLIDFTYGEPTGLGAGSYWHTAEDTIDKVSPKSLQIVAEVVIELFKQLDTFEN